MKRIFLAVTACLILAAAGTGCVQTTDEVKRIIQQDPDILYDVIRKDPVRFLEVLNEAAASAREEMQKRETQARLELKSKEFDNPKQPDISGRAFQGNQDAPITIVTYSDFQCPYCGRGYQTLREVQNAYKGSVRVVYKHLPLDFHPHAMIAAQYFEAISLQSPQKAYAFHDILFSNQQAIQAGGKPLLQKISEGLGIDANQLAKDLNSETVLKRIRADIEEAKSFGFQGTPAFLINGVSLYGAQPLPAFQEIIDIHLQRAAK